ncbi:hypothetical protein BHE74_00022067, partial [Ensete ventricosum]
RDRPVGSGATRNTRRSHGKRFIHRPFTSQRLGSNQAVGPDTITRGVARGLFAASTFLSTRAFPPPTASSSDVDRYSFDSIPRLVRP